MTPIGPEFRPTHVLHDYEALLIRRYMQALNARHKQPRLFHKGCYQGRPQNEDNAIGIKVTSEDVILVCVCCQLFHRNTRH